MAGVAVPAKETEGKKCPITSKILTNSFPMMTPAWRSFSRPVSQTMFANAGSGIASTAAPSAGPSSARGVSRKYLQSYVDEFSFRYNRRYEPEMFVSLLAGLTPAKAAGETSI
jgi:hypothetical protein